MNIDKLLSQILSCFVLFRVISQILEKNYIFASILYFIIPIFAYITLIIMYKEKYVFWKFMIGFYPSIFSDKIKVWMKK
jgi:hypothetical protein